MTETDYPSKVTENNLKQLNERATRIKKRNRWLLFSSLVLYFVLGVFSMIVILFFVVVLVLLISPDFPNDVSIALIPVLFTVIAFPWSFSLLGLIERGLIKIFKLPRHDEVIFSECFIVANHLASNEKRKAIKEVFPLVGSLRSFLKGSDFRRRIYAHEFNLLTNGKKEIRRMLLFSEDKMPELLRSFGLALVRKEDTKAFASLKQILSEVEKYGELKEGFGMLVSVEKYPTLVSLVFSVISLVVTLYLLLSGKIP